jgi:hypothetical protein
VAPWLSDQLIANPVVTWMLTSAIFWLQRAVLITCYGPFTESWIFPWRPVRAVSRLLRHHFLMNQILIPRIPFTQLVCPPPQFLLVRTQVSVPSRTLCITLTCRAGFCLGPNSGHACLVPNLNVAGVSVSCAQLWLGPPPQRASVVTRPDSNCAQWQSIVAHLLTRYTIPQCLCHVVMMQSPLLAHRGASRCCGWPSA